jgi:pimeloyl-ACP methyl ester carboxylesterase
MQDFKQGTVQANNLTFTYLTEGDGPLALCLHGFPDSPYTYRHLLPALGGAGYRAVARSTAGSPRPSFPTTGTTFTAARWSMTRSRCMRRSAGTQTQS